MYFSLCDHYFQYEDIIQRNGVRQARPPMSPWIKTFVHIRQMT